MAAYSNSNSSFLGDQLPPARAFIKDGLPTDCSGGSRYSLKTTDLVTSTSHFIRVSQQLSPANGEERIESDAGKAGRKLKNGTVEYTEWHIDMHIKVIYG